MPQLPASSSWFVLQAIQELNLVPTVQILQEVDNQKVQRIAVALLYTALVNYFAGVFREEGKVHVGPLP